MDTPLQKIAEKLKGSVLFLFDKLIKPRSADEDSRRQEFILNILLVSSILFAVVNLSMILYSYIVLGTSSGGASAYIIRFLLLIFAFLLFLSRRGKFRVSAIILVLLYFVPICYAMSVWGADLPQGLLALAFVLVMSSVLIGTRFSLGLAVTATLVIFALTYKQLSPSYAAHALWKSKPTTYLDAISISFTIGLIAIVSWLSNREIERSLKRARASEEALRQERDLLEVKVEERTRDIKQMQIEKTSQMFRFAEFGRLASGFFHDLASPLTAVSLNLQQLKKQERVDMEDAERYLEQALKITKKLEGFLGAVRKQIRHQETMVEFRIQDEVEDVLQMVGHKARKAHVELLFFSTDEPLVMYGNPFKFNQILLNLISNAIDSHESKVVEEGKTRTVRVEVQSQAGMCICSVLDEGVGIAPEHLDAIFEPFYTTKPEDEGMGIGLSTTRELVKNYFHGQIQVFSTLGKGSRFIVTFPLKPAPV